MLTLLNSIRSHVPQLWSHLPHFPRRRSSSSSGYVIAASATSATPGTHTATPATPPAATPATRQQASTQYNRLTPTLSNQQTSVPIGQTSVPGGPRPILPLLACPDDASSAIVEGSDNPSRGAPISPLGESASPFSAYNADFSHNNWSFDTSWCSVLQP